MKTIHAIYENGVFRPTEPVDLPERSTVEFEPRLVQPPIKPDHLDRVYAILSQSFDTEEPNLAERHNEHQP
jgi:predicted DNA-binding antitoxin AbrB/MazE fold protein